MSRPSQPSLRALEQARARLQEQLASSPEDPKLLQLCARTEERLGRFEEAALLHQRAAKALRAAQDRRAEADAWLEAAQTYARGGQVAKAKPLFQRAIAGHELVGDDEATVRARLAMAHFLVDAKALAEARQQLERCVVPLEGSGAWEEAGWVRERLAEGLAAARELDGALVHAKAAVEAAANAKDRSRFGDRLSAVAGIHRALGNHGKARQYQEKALPHLREAGDRDALLRALDVLIELAVEQDDAQRAEQWLAEAVLSSDLGADLGTQGSYRWRLGALVARRGDDEQARRLLEQAVDRLHKAGDPHSSAPAHFALAAVLQRLGRHAAAARALERAEELFRMVGDDPGAAEVAAARAEVAAGAWQP